jgi:hypothetical protein
VTASARGPRLSRGVPRGLLGCPLPKSYGVSISDKMAGIFVFDAQGRVTPTTATKDVLRQQPA